MGKKLTLKDFINRANLLHENKYDYSKCEYVGSRSKVCITCPIHGEFWQTPFSHLHSYGCPKCGYLYGGSKIRLTQKEFIEKAQKIHGNQYGYSKVVYTKGIDRVCITCPTHGEFWQKPSIHLMGAGCQKCYDERRIKINRVSVGDWIKKARKIHGDKYDYTRIINYKNGKDKLEIICYKHGIFKQRAESHLLGVGCPKCGGNYKFSTSEWIKRVRGVHYHIYDYSKVVYHTNKNKVCIICPTHGEFWQIAADHMKGCGCPSCSHSTLEKEVMLLLDNNNIHYICQKTFPWLKYKNNMRLDFYLPDYNIAIECQGMQHFKPVSFGNYDENFINLQFQLIKKRDKKKYDACKAHGIDIFYYITSDDSNNLLNLLKP